VAIVRHNSMFARCLVVALTLVYFAQLHRFMRFDVALGGVQQVHAKDRVVGPEPQPVDALFERVAENEFVCVRSRVSDLAAPPGG